MNNTTARPSAFKAFLSYMLTVVLGASSFYLIGSLLTQLQYVTMTGWSKFATFGDIIAKFYLALPALIAIGYFIKQRLHGNVLTTMFMTLILSHTALQLVTFLSRGRYHAIAKMSVHQLQNLFVIIRVNLLVDAIVTIAITILLSVWINRVSPKNKELYICGALAYGILVALMSFVTYINRLQPTLTADGFTYSGLKEVMLASMPYTDLRNAPVSITMNTSYVWLIFAFMVSFVIIKFVWNKTASMRRKEKVRV